MTTPPDPIDRWIRDGTTVDAVTLPGSVHSRGRVVAYCEAPSVTIRTATGGNVSWRADLVREASEQPDSVAAPTDTDPAYDRDASELLLVTQPGRQSGRVTIGHSRLTLAAVVSLVRLGLNTEKIAQRHPSVTTEQVVVLAQLAREIDATADDVVDATIDDSEVIAYLTADAAYWREQHRNLAERQRKALNVLTHGEAYHFDEHQLGRNPPEPPVGTVYADPEDGGMHAWTRRDDGWHCPRDECTNCPCGWGEVMQWRGGIDGLVRYLPGELPAYDREVLF